MSHPPTGPVIEKQPWWRGLRALAIGWTIVPLTLMLILAVGATATVLQATVKQLTEANSRTQAQLIASQLSQQLETYRQTFQVITQHYNLPTLSATES